MTQLSATKRRGLEQYAAEVVAALVAGDAMPVIAKRYGVHTSTVMRLAERHKDEIDRATGKIAKAVEDYAIASKVFRIGELDHLYGKMRGELDEYGMFVVEESEDDNGRRVLTRDFRAQMIKAMTGALRQAADELGDIPRAAPAEINFIDKQILVRYVQGPQ